MEKITLKEKLEILKQNGYTYDIITGNIISSRGNILNIAHKSGYISIHTKRDNKNICVLAHQLAWYLYYNEVPNRIDHIDRNRLNNRIENLRLLNRNKNAWNHGDCKGYWYVKNRNKYQASIRVFDKPIYLGSYDTPEEAHQAYLDAKKIYHIIGD